MRYWWLSGKESTCQCMRQGFDPWVRKIPWRRKWHPTPVFLPGKSHGQRSLVGFSPWGHQESGTVEVTARAHTQDLVEGLLRCTLRIGGGWPGSQPPRLSCLEHLPHHCSHQEDGEEKAQALRNKCRTPFQALRISGAYSQSMLQRRAVARKPASLRVPCG